LTTRTPRRIRFNGREFLVAGLNLTDNPLLVPPNEMVDAVNILVGSTLARKKRGGQAYFCIDDSDEEADYPLNPKNNGGTDGDPIIGLYEFWRYDGVSGAPLSTLLVRQADKIWAIEARTGTATDLTGALVLPEGGRVTFQAFEGKVYWVGTGFNGVPEGYNVWDGNLANPATAVPGANQPPDGTPTFILSHGGRMWGWGVPGFPYRAYYSEFYDAENWATSAFGATGTAADPGSLDMDPFGDPVGINGGVSFQDRLYLFMRRAAFEVTGQTINDFVVKTISRQIGTIGHHTIVPIAGDVLYASERGIVRLSSSDKAMESDYGYVSRPIKKFWERGLDRNRYDQFVAAYDEQEGIYMLSAPSKGSTANDTIIAFNASESVWSGIWKGHKARCLSTYIVDGVNRILAGREDGIISLTGERTLLDLGEAYTGRFKTGFNYPGQEIDIQNVWKQVTILAAAEGPGQLALSYYVDSKLVGTKNVDLSPGQDLLGSTFILGQSELGSGVFIPSTEAIKGQGYGLQIEVTFNTENDIEVYGFITEASPAGSLIGGGKTSASS
jgi:hypothetical protein